MNKLKLLVVTLLLISSCATPYKTILPTNSTYQYKTNLTDSIQIYYDFNTMEKSGNRCYHHKENKNGVTVLSVRIENNSDSILKLSEDNLVINTNFETTSITQDPSTYFSRVKRNPDSFIFYGLLGIRYSWTNHSNTISFNPIPLAFGILNYIQANGANRDLIQNIQEYIITGKTIEAHSALNGFIIISKISPQQLNFKLK